MIFINIVFKEMSNEVFEILHNKNLIFIVYLTLILLYSKFLFLD